MKYIKTIVTSLILTMLLGVGNAAASPSNIQVDNFAAAQSLVGDACSGLGQTGANVSNCGTGGGGNTLKSIAHTAVTIMSLVLGAISIIMLIVAGIKFVTSGGDSNSVASARSTLIYALIGLVVAVLAQLLVHYALSTANTIQQHSFLNSSSKVVNDA